MTSMATFVTLALYMKVKPLSFQAPVNGAYVVNLPDVSLTAEVISVDPISRTIVMNWYPVLIPLNGNFACPLNGTIVEDIYMPTEILDTSSPAWTTQVDDPLPAYRLNSTKICNSLSVPDASFRTVTKLIASKAYLQVEQIRKQSTFQSYPFDVYVAPFLFYTKNVETGKIRGLYISDSFGIAVNFEMSLQSSFVNKVFGVPESLQFFLRVERSMATKTFVVIVGITNWLTAIAFLTICAATIVYKHPRIYSEMFVIPVGAVFAFSSIRSNFPGAPAGFGATIDIFTILPVLVIMSLCSFFLLLIILYRRILQELDKTDSEGKICHQESEIMVQDDITRVSSRTDISRHAQDQPLQKTALDPDKKMSEEKVDEGRRNGSHPACPA